MLLFSPLKKLSFFSLALLISAVLHIALIAIVRFEQPVKHFFNDKVSAFDVVLVNSKSKTAPKKADALAQANLDGGGNTSENRELKSAMPWQKPQASVVNVTHQSKSLEKTLAEAEALAARKAERLAELDKQARALMTQIKSKQAVETNPTQQSRANKPENNAQDAGTKSVNTPDLVASSLEIARLEAQINKQQDEYQHRPKRKSIGGRTQEYKFANYVESWRQKVERIGNLNYPEAAKDQKIYGQLQLTVYIKSTGEVEKVDIRRSSGHAVLDAAAKRIVEMGAPYAAFPEDLRKEVDIIDITRTMIFTTEDSLATKASE
jgi:protein TonB